MNAMLLDHGVLLASALAPGTPWTELWREARALWPSASRCEATRHAADPRRGGDPARRFAQATGGAAQAAFASDPALLRALRTVCGVSLRPSGTGTYSYYEGAGDHLALHRDLVSCEVTVLTCLYQRGGGGVLWTWPQRRHELLPHVAATSARGAVPVTLRAGESAILLGGAVPHCLAPLTAGQARVVSVLCYSP